MYSTSLARAASRVVAGKRGFLGLPKPSPFLWNFSRRWYAKDDRPNRSIGKTSEPNSGKVAPGRNGPGPQDRTWKHNSPTKFAAAGGAGVKSSSNLPRSTESERYTAEFNTEAEPSKYTEPRSSSGGQNVEAPNSSAGRAVEPEVHAAEFNPDAKPSKNTEPRASGGQQGSTTTGPSTQENGEDSRAAELGAKAAIERDDLTPHVEGTAASDSHNTGSSESSAEKSARYDEQRTQPLPDLRHGIPSTFGAEFGRTPAGQETSGGALNITESPEEASSTGGGGRRDGGGDLPKSAYVSSFEKRRERFANYAYATFFAFATVGTLYLGRNWDSEEEERLHPDAPSGWGLSLFYQRCRARLSGQVGYYTEPAFPRLLPDMDPSLRPPYTLVLSLEDLLVHSEWTRKDGWRTAKRPGVDYFLRYLQQYYELVIFTSQPMMNADPVIRKLDPYRIVMWPLFREATKYENGKYIKDLSYLNRDLSKVILIDTDESHAKRQPENAIIVEKWKGDAKDKELVSLIPFLEYVASMGIDDTRQVLKSFEGKHIPTEFAQREKKIREMFEKELAEERKKRPKHSGMGFLGKSLGITTPATMGDELTASQAFEQGKMLLDQVRERGQKTYEMLDKEIRENGAKWLEEMAAEEKKAQEEQVKSMRSGFTSGVTGWFGGGSK